MWDNISLKYLFDQQNLNDRKDRWFSFLSECDFEIHHINGKENKDSYALSHHTNLLFSNNSYESDLENQILNVENSDKVYQNLKENTAENEKNQIKIDLV